MVVEPIASAAAAATLTEKACCHPTTHKLGVQLIMYLCGGLLPLSTRFKLASCRIQHCSGHGDFKTATVALLDLLELAAPRIRGTSLAAPILLRKAAKAIALMLQYFNNITKGSAVDQCDVATRITSMPTIFLSATIDACTRQVRQPDNKISPQLQQLYTTLLIRACRENVRIQETHLDALVYLFAATLSNAEYMLPLMKAVSAAVGPDGRSMLLQLLSKQPAKLPAPCMDMFLQIADACAAGASGLPIGGEARVIQSAMGLLLDVATGAETVATTSATLMHVAAAEPAYARALAVELEQHMAVAPARKLARDLLLTPSSVHVPADVLRQLGTHQPLADRVRIVCALVVADVPAAAVVPLTRTAPLPANNNRLDETPTTRLLDEVSNADQAAMQAATNALCQQINQHGSRHPAVQLLIWLCTVAVEFRPHLDHLSTAMGVRILLMSSSNGASTSFDIGNLAFVYPNQRWVDGDMHCWMLFFD